MKEGLPAYFARGIITNIKEGKYTIGVLYLDKKKPYL